MFFFSSTDGQMTWNAFKEWLISDEALHSLEELSSRYQLGRYLSEGDNMLRRERIAKKCLSLAKKDEYLRGRYIFRGDAGDAGYPNDSRCFKKVDEEPFKITLDGTDFGKMVDDFPSVDDISLGEINNVRFAEDEEFVYSIIKNQGIVRELFKLFLSRMCEIRSVDDNLRDYSDVMLFLESLPCAYRKEHTYERWFAISYSYNENQCNTYWPWAYKKERRAKSALKCFAELIIPHDWHRYKIVVEDKVATILNLDTRSQNAGYNQSITKIRLQVEPLSVSKGRLIPLNEPPVKDWDVVRAKDWETRNFTMGQWLERMDARIVGAEAADAAAVKCDWWKFDFERLNEDQWVEVLRYRPELIDQCPCVNNFNDYQWCSLLRRQPQFADRFNRWNDLFPGLWSFLLCRQPQFANDNRFIGWSSFDSCCWVRLLKDQPQFSDLCPWGDLSGYEWQDLIIVRPEFASRCDWFKLTGADWKDLLVARPEFEIYCNWDELSGSDWSGLLVFRPEFASRCNWSKLTSNDWVGLLMHNPSYFNYCKCDNLETYAKYQILMSHPELAKDIKGWEQFSEMQQMCLLKKSSLFCKFVDWENLSFEKKIDYLLLSTEFQNMMDWRLITDKRDWFRLLSVFPEEYLKYAPAGCKGANSRSYVWIGQSGLIVVIPVRTWTSKVPDYPVDAKDRADRYRVTWGSVERGGGKSVVSSYEAELIVDKIFSARRDVKAFAIDGVYVETEYGKGAGKFATIMKNWFANNETSIKILYLENAGMEMYSSSVLEG